MNLSSQPKNVNYNMECISLILLSVTFCIGKYFQLYLMHKLLKLMAKFKWKLIYTMADEWVGYTFKYIPTNLLHFSESDFIQ